MTERVAEAGGADPALPALVGIVGTGLVGTSLALALQRAGGAVLLCDVNAEALALACRLTGAASWTPGATPASAAPDVIAVCVPPEQAGAELARASSLYLDATVTDVTSVKARPLLEAEALGGDLTRIVGGHPMAGRERAGPASARADLFEGRPWALCPGERTQQRRVEVVRAMAQATGAVPVTLGAAEHDQAVAALSHVPQLVASALAATLGSLPDPVLTLAGPGAAEMTRLASSPPQLWSEVIPRNAGAVRAALEALLAALRPVGEALGAPDPDAIADAVRMLITTGGRGRARLRMKSTSAAGSWRWLAVVLVDRPGELARLLTAAAAAGINVEDLRIDHALHQPTGVVDLAVRPEAAAALRAAVEGAGWACALRDQDH